MKRLLFWINWFALAALFGVVLYSTSAHASSFNDGSSTSTPAPTIISSCRIQSVDGNFSGFQYRYSTRGSCAVFLDSGRGASAYDNPGAYKEVKPKGEAQWTAEGTYNPTTKETSETISVSQKNYDAPDYIATGTIFTTMVCAKDPWLAPDGLSCGSAIPQTSGYIDPQYKAIYPGNPSVPATSRLSSPQRIALNQQYQLSRPVTPSTGIISPNAYNTALPSPAVLAPAAGLKTFTKMAVPIKLAPPAGWNVTNYTVTIQKQDPRGNWVTYSTVPVTANQAQSAAGYTAFGPGPAAALLSVPGTWRLMAQATAPKTSGWSNWVEFTVWQSPVSTTVTNKTPASLAK